MIRYDYASLDAVHEATALPSINGGNDQYRKANRNSPSSWGGNHTLESAIAAASTPKPEAMQAIDAMKRKIMGDIEMPTANRRKRVMRQDYGAELDAEMVAMRRADAWDDVRQVKRPALRTVKLGIDLSAKASITHEQLLNRGAACCALMDCLQEIGCDVELIGYFTARECNDYTNRTYLHTVTIKRPDMPTDPGAVVVSICEAWWMRIILSQAVMARYETKTSHAISRVLTSNTAIRAECDICIEQELYTATAAEAFIRQEIARFQTA